jgi:predicted transcriptional regulator
MEAIEHMRIVELNYLPELFTLCGCDMSRGFNIYEIGSRCGCSWNEAKQITQGLSSLDLLKTNNPGSHEVSITQKGIDLMKGERTMTYRYYV